jgi:hypothetical protein
MPNDILAIKISNSDPKPNGAAAVMSRTGTGYPDKATFKALDRDYTITLHPGYWLAWPAGTSFPLPKGTTSSAYQLDPDAPLGAQGPYSIDPPSREHVPPEIIIEP